MRFFEWLKKIFSRKDKHLMLNAAIQEQKEEEKIIPTPIENTVEQVIGNEPIVEEISEEEEMQKRLASP